MVELGWGSWPRQRSHGLAASELGGVPLRTGPRRLVALLLCLSCPWTVACGKGHVSVDAGGVKGTLVAPWRLGLRTSVLVPAGTAGPVLLHTVCSCLALMWSSELCR